jgi:hypothetical protein
LKLLKYFNRDKTRLDGRYPLCKECSARSHKKSRNKISSDPERLEKRRAYQKKWRKDNPDKMRLHHRRVLLKRKYGLTIEEYETILASQGGGCAICNKKPNCLRSHPVDHDHDTKRVRGILCINCNIAVGNIYNNPKIATKMAEYLENE